MRTRGLKEEMNTNALSRLEAMYAKKGKQEYEKEYKAKFEAKPSKVSLSKIGLKFDNTTWGGEDTSYTTSTSGGTAPAYYSARGYDYSCGAEPANPMPPKKEYRDPGVI